MLFYIYFHYNHSFYFIVYISYAGYVQAARWKMEKYILLRDKSWKKKKSSVSQPAARHPACRASPPFTKHPLSEPATAQDEFLDMFMM